MEQKKNLTPEKLWELGRVSIDTINNFGDIIYGVQYFNIKENKSIRDLFFLNNKGSIQQITNTTENCKALSFKNIEEFIYSEGENIFIYNLKTESKTKINTEKETFSGLVFSKKEKYTAYNKQVKEENTTGIDFYPEYEKSGAKIYNHLMYRHWDSWKDGAFQHIFITDKEGKIIDINKGEKYNAESYTFSPNEKYLVYQSKKLFGTLDAVSTNTNIYLYDTETEKTINITQDNNGYDTNPKFSLDGEFLAWLSMETNGYESDKNDIKVYNFRTGKTENLTSGWDNTVITYNWGKNNKKIYFLAGINATQQFFELDIETREIKQITQGKHDYVSIFTAGDFLYGERQDMNHASEIYKVHKETGEQNKLTTVNDSLYEQINKSKIDERWIKTSDGKEMLTWIIYPPDFDKNKKYPALLYCQGGPQSTVSQFYSFRWNFQTIAAQGYIVIAPNRRGLPSFGVEWNKAISGDWGGQPMRDYLSAIDEISNEPFIDKNRLGAIGASYGGYSVYYLAGIHNKRFKTFISHCGVFDLESMYGTTEEIFFPNHDIGGAYWQEPQPKAYQEFNPIKLVNHWDTPILIIHGGRDYRVPYHQGMEAFQVAQLKGIKSRFLFFPEESHWIQEPQNGLIWQKEFFKWLKETL